MLLRLGSMRILMTTRGSAGHLLPLAPIGHACLRAGHEVLVAAQRDHQGNVERTGLPFAPVDAPPPEEWMPLLAEFGQLDMETANARMIGDYFGRLDTAAALPGLRAIVEEWRPDVIVRELLGVRLHARRRAARHPGGARRARAGGGRGADDPARGRALDAARADLGLPPDPAGDRLRDTPYFTTIPEPLEDPAAAAPRRTHRFRHGAPPTRRRCPTGGPATTIRSST